MEGPLLGGVDEGELGELSAHAQQVELGPLQPVLPALEQSAGDVRRVGCRKPVGAGLADQAGRHERVEEPDGHAAVPPGQQLLQFQRPLFSEFAVEVYLRGFEFPGWVPVLRAPLCG